MEKKFLDLFVVTATVCAIRMIAAFWNSCLIAPQSRTWGEKRDFIFFLVSFIWHLRTQCTSNLNLCLNVCVYVIHQSIYTLNSISCSLIEALDGIPQKLLLKVDRKCIYGYHYHVNDVCIVYHCKDNFSVMTFKYMHFKAVSQQEALQSVCVF